MNVWLLAGPYTITLLTKVSVMTNSITRTPANQIKSEQCAIVSGFEKARRDSLDKYNQLKINQIKRFKLINLKTHQQIPLCHISDDFAKTIAPEIVWNNIYQGYEASEATYKATIVELNRALKEMIESGAMYAGVDVVLATLNTSNRIATGDIGLKLDLLHQALEQYYNAQVDASFK